MAQSSQKSCLGPAAMEEVAPSEESASIDSSLLEIVWDVFAVVKDNQDKKLCKEVSKAWVLNQVKRDRDLAETAISHARQRSPSKRSGSSSSRISWCKVTQPDKPTTETKFVKQRANLVPIHMMPLVRPLQRMNMWTSLPRNYREPDDANEPVNIPYFEDEIYVHEKKLVDVFSLDYEQRSSHCKYTETENQIFYEAVQKLLEIVEVKDSGAARNKNIPIVPPNEVFVAINNCFPEGGNVEDLKERFNHLLRKWHPRANELGLIPASTLLPNIDDDSANTESYPRSTTLHTFGRLFCRRCLIYDCLVHPDKDEFISSEFIAKRGNWLLPQEACGPMCYGNHKLEAGSSKLEQKVAHWKPVDETMCRALKDVYPGNICAISKVMLKSCKEVYEFILRDSPEAFVPSMAAVSSYISKKELPKRKVFTGTKGQRTGMVWGALKPEDLAEIATIVYKPCGHPGMSCSEYENCPCKEARTPCEKFCACAADCKHRFVGCRCESTCESKACPCLAASRECDPDLCSSCGCSDYDVSKLKCKNVSIQRMMKKKLKLAKSDIPNAGWGIYAGEPISKNEFISEYVGELISGEEADRRAQEYNARCHTYLFELNQDFAVDATRKGNKIRFANHSSSPNAMFKVMKVNTDHRIGIYATRNIEAGEELFLNYENVLMEHGSVVEERKMKDKKTRKRRCPE